MLPRRHFIATSVAACVSVAAHRAAAIDPFNRPVPGRMRLSLAAYSMRKYLSSSQDKAASMDLFGFVDYCRELGLDGAELTSYYFPEDVDEAYLLRLKRHCHLAGMTITGGAIRNDFCSADADKVTADLEHTKQWIDRYAILGAPAIRIFAGSPVRGEELKKTLARCATNCQIACDYAQSKGVMLALENHGGVTAQPEGLLQIVHQVDSPAFGINFDSGNFHETDDPYGQLAKIAPYAVNAQLKVEMKPRGRVEEADLSRVLTILRDAGYSGWVALEYEAAEEPREAIPNWTAKIQPMLQA